MHLFLLYDLLHAIRMRREASFGIVRRYGFRPVPGYRSYEVSIREVNESPSSGDGHGFGAVGGAELAE